MMQAAASPLVIASNASAGSTVQNPIQPPPVVKKQRGGYRPNSGRKRIHPIKPPKNGAQSNASPKNARNNQPKVYSQPAVMPAVAIRLPSNLINGASQWDANTRITRQAVQQARNKDFSSLINIEHQKMQRINGQQETPVQDFEIELLLGLDRVHVRQAGRRMDEEHVSGSDEDGDISFGSSDEDNPRKRRYDLDEGTLIRD
jgi:hypothetical protein